MAAPLIWWPFIYFTFFFVYSETTKKYKRCSVIFRLRLRKRILHQVKHRLRGIGYTTRSFSGAPKWKKPNPQTARSCKKKSGKRKKILAQSTKNSSAKMNFAEKKVAKQHHFFSIFGCFRTNFAKSKFKRPNTTICILQIIHVGMVASKDR